MMRADGEREARGRDTELLLLLLVLALYVVGLCFLTALVVGLVT